MVLLQQNRIGVHKISEKSEHKNICNTLDMPQSGITQLHVVEFHFGVLLSFLLSKQLFCPFFYLSVY